MDLYSARIHQLLVLKAHYWSCNLQFFSELITTQLRFTWCHRMLSPLYLHITLLPLLIRRISHSWNHLISLGEYTAQLLPFRRIGLIKHNNQLCPHRYPFSPGWREAIMVKCLAQGHKHHGRDRDSNPHSDDSAIRTQIPLDSKDSQVRGSPHQSYPLRIGAATDSVPSFKNQHV